MDKSGPFSHRTDRRSQIKRKMGRTRSGGPRFCADVACGRCRGGPVDHPAKQERRPSRMRDLEHGYKGRIGSVKNKSSGNLPELLFLIVRKMGLEPTRLQ